MWILTLFFFLFPYTALAQLDPGTGSEGNCTENTFALPATDPGTNTYDCQDVTIGNLPTINDPSLPLTIRATGTVTITGTISFEGANAVADVGGNGGPGGGGLGGSYLFGVNPGLPPGQGGDPPTNAAGCLNPDSAEGSGGAGGNLISFGAAGKKGNFTSGPSALLADPGVPGLTTVNLDLNNFVSAGAGGGSGHSGCENGSDFGHTPGGGGGGGGAIRIIAAGDITITSTGTIRVSGGRGGEGTGLGGGGGGGSGGFIVLQTLSNISLNNSLSALAGPGGTNFSPSLLEGDGGAGAPGFIMLEDLNGTRTFTGVAEPSSPINSTQSLNSDISCGTIAKGREESQSFLMMMAMGFFLIWGIKTLSRFRMKF